MTSKAPSNGFVTEVYLILNTLLYLLGIVVFVFSERSYCLTFRILFIPNFIGLHTARQLILHKMGGGASSVDVVKTQEQHIVIEQLDDSPEVLTMDEEKLVRKIDLFLLPTIWLMYLLSYMDRTK